MTVRFLCDQCSYQIHLETPPRDGVTCPTCRIPLCPLAAASSSVLPSLPNPVSFAAPRKPIAIPVLVPSDEPEFRYGPIAAAGVLALGLVAAVFGWTAYSKHQQRLAQQTAAASPQPEPLAVVETPLDEGERSVPSTAVAEGPLPKENAVSARPVPEEPKQTAPPLDKAEPKPPEKTEPAAQQPPPVKAEPKETPSQKPVMPFKRRDKSSEEDLRKQLLLVPEVSLDQAAATRLQTLARNMQNSFVSFQGPAMLAAQRPDLQGLPLRMGVDCHLGKEPAENLQVLSRKLRTVLEKTIPKDGVELRPNAQQLREALLNDPKAEWLQAEAVPCLLQLLQAENSPIRKVLIEVLGQIKDKRATEALAMRAMLDLNADVREAAARELLDRPLEDYEPLLLSGLRYPWAPVALHAAETLAFVKDRDVVPQLVTMLDLPDAALPFGLGKRPGNLVLREVVRINHLGNCVLCHAPSFVTTDLVRGAVPTPGLPLPAPATTPQYYDNGSIFVHADVTYLRQDFSVMQPVDRHGPWPQFQRFDYLVRVRPATTAEQKLVAERQLLKTMLGSHEAALFALREITGKDLGATAKEWKPVLQTKMVAKGDAAKSGDGVGQDWKQFVEVAAVGVDVSNEADAERLKTDLLAASAAQQEKLLVQLRDAKGLPYTDALVEVIGQLKGSMQVKARELLAERLARMTDTTLRARLSEASGELRRAAAQAVGLKRSKALVSDLLPLLEDRDDAVIQAARLSLQTLTERDFGPAPDADRAAREKAMADWKAWWKQQSGT